MVKKDYRLILRSDRPYCFARSYFFPWTVPPPMTIVILRLSTSSRQRGLDASATSLAIIRIFSMWLSFLPLICRSISFAAEFLIPPFCTAISKASARCFLRTIRLYSPFFLCNLKGGRLFRLSGLCVHSRSSV